MKLDMLGFEPHFVDHLAAVMHRLPEEMRGTLIVPSRLRARAVTRGILGSPDIVDDSRPLLVASWGDLKKARLLGRERLAFIEHGIGQSYHGDPKSAGASSYAGGHGREDVGLFLVPNEDAEARWRAAYPKAMVGVVGSPKAERTPQLTAGTGDGVVAISFHFPCAISPEAGSAFGDFKSALPQLSERFRVLGHGHPRAWKQIRLATHYQRAGITSYEDFNEVCERASVYICDNSSTLYEFASTGRPVVVLNASAYRRKVNHGLRFWDAADVGIQVDRPGDLVAAVEEAIADAPERKAARERALALVYQPRDDLVETLAAWMTGARRAAA